MKDVEKTLEKLWNKGGDSNFWSIAQEPYFFQVIAPKKGMEMYIDAVSNNHLPDDAQLSEEQIKKIKDLGFEEAPRSGDFTITLPFGRNRYEKGATVIEQLMEIYGMNPKKIDSEVVYE